MKLAQLVMLMVIAISLVAEPQTTKDATKSAAKTTAQATIDKKILPASVYAKIKDKIIAKQATSK